MEARRGLLAAVGAGTALAAAGLAVLVVVSVVLAVHGWPQVSSADGSARVTLRAEVAGEHSAAAAAPAPVALPHRPRHSGDSPLSRVALRAPAQRRRPSPKRAAAPSTATVSAPSASAPPSAPVTTVTKSVGGSVTTVTDTAGGVLRPVGPQLADTVTQTGHQVGKAVGNLVGAVTGAGQ